MLCLRRVILYGLLISVSHCLLIHAQGPGPGQLRRDVYNNQMEGQGGGGGRRSVYSRTVDMRVQFSVKEGLPRGTFVGRIPTKPGFTYRFNENLVEFHLNGTTGEIRTNKEIDREALPSDQFDLVVLSSQPTYPIDVRITIEDINDQSPAFPAPEIEVRFSEGANAGTLVFLDPAEDKDKGINDVTTEYKILDGNDDNHFRLVVTTNPSGEPPFLHLETTSKLDRETKAFYTLNISAQDGGTPPRFGYLKVNIAIDDSNDNSPNFDHSDYVVSLNESVPPGTVVLQVTATDNDEGDNARITYYLSETETQFTVDSDTGVVSTMQILNCQQNHCAQNQHNCPKSCVFTVFARDHGVPRQDGRTYITVNLLDSNDHDPSLIIRYFPPTASSASVDENASNGSVVAAISVVDEDEGPNGDTIVQIVSGNELGHFRLESTPSFQLVRVNGVLDREKISKYNLTIVATDKGSPPRSSTTFIIIRINDVNDHNPHFLKTEYSAVLRELVPVGTYVATLTATDEDTGINSQVYYSIVSGNEAMWFHIDPNSGLLTTRAPLDREQQGTIRLKISARDGGPNPKWAHAQIKITILDDNDERPQLTEENLTVTLSEESPPGSLVATITASDHDQGTNGSVSYYLSQESEYAYSGVFHVDPTNGRLTSRLKFDRETLNTYTVQVIAKDQGTPALSSTATVHLSISDVNDNDPQIYPTDYYVTISPDTMINTKIVQIQAFDPDEGVNSKIQFSLDSGSDGFFTLDESTGNIFLKKDLKTASSSSLTRKRFQLSISAKDGGGRKSRDKATVEIVIKSTDTEMLKCKQDMYSFSIVEDFGVMMKTEGKEVGKVEMSSSSSSVPGKGIIMKYSIIAGDQQRIFSVDENSGMIRSVKAVDREVKSTYTLTILARTGNAYGSCTVTIGIQDVNDHAPKYGNKRVVTELSENSPIDCEVYLVKADDPDLGENARISYFLTSNPDNMFSIDSSNGLISLNKPLRFSPDLTEVNIEVTAKDNGSPPLSSRQSILIKVTDYNNHSPIFDHSSYETSLLETTAVNSRFFALQATDQDSGENSVISYEIVDGNGAQKFGVFPDGYLYVKTPLDREEQDYFSLTVMARDNGSPQRSSTVSVVIHLIDENDNAPVLKNSTFTFYIAENEPPDTYVGKVTATDSDVGRNAELTYSIHSVQSDFIVDPKNGFVKSIRSFDRENLVQTTGQDFIALEIIVQDGGAVRLSDKAQMIVYITDVNDHTPLFLRPSYSAQISEAAQIGSQVIRVIASDMDEGLNGDMFYYLGEGNDGDVFKIDTIIGQISLAKSLDRETKAQYILTVVCQDTAESHPLSSSTTVKIDVTDENDNSPIILQSESRISIIETTPVNTELIKFQTSDPDLGLNQQVVLSITAGNRHETFRIDPKSGSLYLNKPLDFERYSSYTLNITASDFGNPRLSTSIQFMVLVQDYNDNTPMFPSTAIVRQIQEGIAINTPIVTVSAEDPDSGLNGKVKYSIIAQDPEGNHFGIDPNQGIIHTLKPIDREFADTFRLTVVATDQAIPPSSRLSAEKLVTVIVEDINDSIPQFISMNAALLAKGTEKNTEIVRVKAKDLDSESNGAVTYEMISGDSSLFKLDRSTGSLALKRSVGDVLPRYQLTIRATDEAIQSQRKSSDLYLSILGVSDKSQSGLVTFSEAEYKGAILENEPIGSSILTVAASISDKSFSGGGGGSSNNNNPEIEYYITNITSTNGDMQDKLFDIDLRRGILSTAAILDREMGVWRFQLEIYAIVVSTRGLHTASTKVLIDIIDRNDSPAQFSSKQMVLNISENAPVGQEITTITATDADTLGTISYSIVKGDDGKFKLDSSTGVLKVMDALDRETKEEYRIVVRAFDGIQHIVVQDEGAMRLSDEAEIIVHVTDVNDNSPEFSPSTYSFDIPEDASPGYKVGTITALDPDKDANGQVTYSVLSDWGNDVFSLNSQTGVFTLTTRLDYEEVQHYIFVIQAQDMGKPSLSSTTTVYCNVIDLNDNSPVFDPMSYNREVYENISVGSSVVTVSATDLDFGLNGKVSYSIVSGNDNEVFDVSENGTIFTKTFLDRETKPFYTLVVEARDSGELKQLSSSVQVSIILKDVNDEAAQFISPNETSVVENSPLNTVLLVVKAIDKDEGRNSQVEYILNNEKSTFTLGPVDGLLRVSSMIDRETKQNYTLKITAKDRGEPSKSSSQELFVLVNDANDNSPNFDPRQYSAAIPENSSIGMSVLQVSATDIDEGVNRQIRFTIIGGDPNRDFVVSEDSGVLRLAKSLNYERKKSYTLIIQAEDSGQPVRYDTATVFINVLDVNDNCPKFLDSPYLAYVRENMVNLPATVLQVKAYDADSAVNNHQVRYLMKDGDKGSFRVNTTTGEITVHRALDRERQSEYMLTLIAMDQGTPRLTGTGMVRVVVQDVNDHSPKMEHERYEFILEENVPLNTVVGQVVATDDDQEGDLNALIRYHIEDNQRGLFDIKEDTGEIVTLDKIDREAQEIYHLTVKASDSSPVLQRSSYTNVTIRIKDVNDNAPSFNKSRYTVNIADNIVGGGYVLGVSATDSDTGVNSKIRYNLEGEDADKFQISEKTGVIKSLTNLKNTGSTQFNLEVRATDSSPTKPLTSTCHVQVSLVSHSRFPTIRSGTRQFTFPENASNANVTTIGGVSTNNNTIFNYYIGGGNLGDAFRIDVNSGLLQISSLGLDFETAQDYELWIEVSDEKEPNLKSAIPILVNVTDYNNNAPVFENNVYNLSVPEEEPGPRLITTLVATDIDSGVNGKVEYHLSESSAMLYGSIFGVQAETGEIFTKVKLDREEVAQYTLTIEAVDFGSPVQTGSATLVVNVEDKNDNPPRFTRLFSVNVTENVPIGTFVIQVTSVDKDVGANANCTYSFTENTYGKFKIDPLSGNVTVSGLLDRESQDEYLLKVAAIDGSWRAETLVTITIQDLNDNSPTYEYSYYNFNIPEGDQPVAFVGQVRASDRDKRGPNSLVSYSLKQPSDYFSVDPVSGEIFSKKPLKYKPSSKRFSPENEHSLVVTATDSGKPPMSSECVITINVVDANNTGGSKRKSNVISSDSSDDDEIVEVGRIINTTSGQNSSSKLRMSGQGRESYIDMERELQSVTEQGGSTRSSSRATSVDDHFSFDTDEEIPVRRGSNHNLVKVVEYIIKAKGNSLSHSEQVRLIQEKFPDLQYSINSFYDISNLKRKCPWFVEGQQAVGHHGPPWSVDENKKGLPFLSRKGQVPPTIWKMIQDAEKLKLIGNSGKQSYYFFEGNIVDDKIIEIPADSDDYNYRIYCRLTDKPAPEFEKKSYFTPVLEDSKVGQKVIQVRANDPDGFGINAELEYLKISGNGSELFNIEKDSGWITVAESLIGRKLQRYVMQLRVVDKGIPPQSDDVNIVLVITGPNKFTPVFSALSYRVIVPENEAIGSVIVTVTATDQDMNGPNGQIIYNITKGNEQKKFSIDPSSGAVSINQDLDYDTKKEYHLNISAIDLGYHPKSSEAQLTVILTDINNSPPTFNKTRYTANLKENSPTGTRVIRLVADDKDSPKNAIIRYSIVGGSGKNSFSMDSVSGVISSSKVFNYEERREYFLEILASNPDSNLFGTTQVQVLIQGENEYYPKFVQAVFQFTVSESAPIGFQVGALQATDEDIGEDGNVYYLFVGSSNDRGFSINPTTGIISVSRRLDRESQSRVVLTVLAKNGGSIRGNDTDEAQVIILVQDGNDPPIFDKDMYHANVSEGAAIGSRVTVVKASDVDVRPSNNRFSYEIIGGNPNKIFKIDPISGIISTALTLDRETIPTYELVVGAIDMGQPPQTGTTLVQVLLLDINDSGPVLDNSSREGSIPENEPPNTKVMTLRAVDPDLRPNGEPFTFTLVGGPDASKFKIDFNSGTVTSLVPFDRESTPELKIVVEIQDSGKPPMKSRQDVKIVVTDVNDSPSQPRNGQLILYTFKDIIPKDRVALVVPMDPDIIGQYTCRLEKNEDAFKIPTNCDLHLNKLPTYKRQSLKILADDGRHGEVASTMLVEFLSFDNQTLDNSVIVRIIGLSPRTFLTKFYTKLLSYFRQIFRYEPHIYSILDTPNGTDIVLAAGSSGSTYERPEDLTNSLILHKSHIESLLDASIIPNYSPCTSFQSVSTNCPKGERCDTGSVCQNGAAACTKSLRAYTSSTRISDSPLLVLSSPTVQMDFFCQCPAGFTGKNCERKKEPCQPNPCFHGVTCNQVNTSFGFECGPCPRGFKGDGQNCERQQICKGANPCLNGGACQENPQAGSYFCLCRPGFFGNQCQAAADACRPNPCLNGGECISNLGAGAPSAYPRCKCPNHYYGRHCEKSAFGFSLGSFMSFPQLDPNTNDISLIFSTNKRNALLVYNFGEQTGGRSDFVAIELLNGVPSLSYGGARTAIAIITVNKFVSDGGWHRIIATRNSRVISLSVSSCKDSGELCADCRPGDPTCYSDDVGPTGTLNFNGNPLLLGGLQNVDSILQRPDQIHTDDFIGCIHGVVVNGRQLNLSAALESRAIANTCQRVQDVCDSSHHKCGVNGKCIDLWDSYTCQCSNNIISPNCDEAFYPYTFSVGSFVEYKIGEKYRRSQLLYSSPYHQTGDDVEQKMRKRKRREIRSKSISFNFRTIHNEAVLLYAASDKDYTMIELENGGLKFSSKIGSSNYPINMSVSDVILVDGQWHSVKLSMNNQVIQISVDGERQGEELDSASGHDFLDPYLTILLLGGLKDESLQSNKIFTGFAGCMSNFTINDELQPLNGSGGIFDEVIHYGKMSRGCSNARVSAATAPDPLSIGVTLVIVFFVILLVAILVSFVVFRLRRREKSPLPPLTPSTKQSPAQQTTSDIVRNHVLDGEADAIRNLVKEKTKKIGDPNNQGGYQKPDIIERTTSTPSHNNQSGNSPSNSLNMNCNNGISMDPAELAEMPEHYDLENASSIAPSDIDIVYHYKGFRDNLSGGGRNKSSPFRHNHHFPGSRQSPGIRQSPISSVLKSTPLARLSPSSELSQQTTPRILTLQDISGKPLQSALLATTQKGESERSLNISHSSRSSIVNEFNIDVNPSSQGTKKKRKKCAGESNMTIGLTAEEIERLNKNKNFNSLSLVSTLDAVSSSESDDRRKNKLSDLLESRGSNAERMQRPHRDTSSDDDESGNDSFTCSEFEYDNEKRDYRPSHMIFSKLAEVENEEAAEGNGEEDYSFRGSLSTLVASDDDLAYINYSKTTQNPNGGSGSSMGWDYLLNWGPNFQQLVGVFKDIAELPDGPNGALSNVPPPSGSASSRRYPTPRPASEEYV